MTRVFAAVAVAAVLLGTPAAQTPTFRTGIDLVRLGVTVSDRQGIYVTDLTADDFVILEDGKPQRVAYFARGEEGPAHALAAMADPDLARRIADQIGKVPDATLAMCLGEILVRPDFGPDTARVEVVRAIGKIGDPAAVHALVDYLNATPKTDKSTARTEAQGIVNARGGQ